MGIQREIHYRARCDGDNCSHYFWAQNMTLKEFYKELRLIHWVIGSKIYCPEHIPFFHSQNIECPNCRKIRLVRGEHIKKSTNTNKGNPERIGLCRSCRMKIVKPAKKN